MRLISYSGNARKALVGAAYGGNMHKTIGGCGLQAGIDSAMASLSPATPAGNQWQAQPQSAQRTKRAVASAP